MYDEGGIWYIFNVMQQPQSKPKYPGNSEL